MSDELITTDNPLTAEERQLLAVLAGMMIPASQEYDVPGADDERILANILTTSDATLGPITEQLKALDGLSVDRHGEHFPALDSDNRTELLMEFGGLHPLFIPTLVGLVLRSYYQDDRVLASLDMEARPPYPEGFIVEQGDWSLLAPVKQRPKMYRKDS